MLGLGGTVPFPQLYWYGIGTFYFGFAVLAVSALFERWRIVYRIGACLLWVVIAAVVSIKMVFVSVPLIIAPLSDPGNYAVGTDVSGIKWEKGLSELRIMLSNQTIYDYDDVDIYFKPDVPTRRVVQVTHVPDVSLDIIEPGSVSVSGRTYGLYASSMGFRMRCPKIPKHTTVEILAALVMPDAQPLGESDPGKSRDVFIELQGDIEQFAAPKKIAAALLVEGQYIVLNRPRDIKLGFFARRTKPPS